METQNNLNLLNGSDNENSKFATKKWYVISQKVFIQTKIQSSF